VNVQSVTVSVPARNSEMAPPEAAVDARLLEKLQSVSSRLAPPSTEIPPPDTAIVPGAPLLTASRVIFTVVAAPLTTKPCEERFASTVVTPVPPGLMSTDLVMNNAPPVRLMVPPSTPGTNVIMSSVPKSAPVFEHPDSSMPLLTLTMALRRVQAPPESASVFTETVAA
jgi:hypothetical protein